MKLPDIWIGTSNIVVPGNKQSFPAPYNQKSRLHYYSALFNSVEINQTFYKVPMPSTFERWAEEVAENFTFTVKLSKDITHHKSLKSDPGLVDNFLYAAERLGNKKGCLLVQFPGKVTLDHFNEVEAILEKIEAEGPLWKKAVEFRHNSWYTGETYELLNEYNCALVLQDMPKSKRSEIATDVPFVYLRFHGPAGDYRDSYSDDFLLEKAKQIAGWQKEGKEVFVYFNNTIGDAFQNAVTLNRFIRSLP